MLDAVLGVDAGDRAVGDQRRNRRWLFDPARSGQALVMSAIGCHAQHLAYFVTGQRVARVSADAGVLVPGRQVIDHVSALIQLRRRRARHVHGHAGGRRRRERHPAARLRREGLIDWSHREPSYLKLALNGEPVRTIGRGDAYLSPEVIAAGRTPRGHPEGLREAFANLYAEIAQERIARELGEAIAPPPYPPSKTARTRWRHRSLSGVAGARALGRCGERLSG